MKFTLGIILLSMYQLTLAMDTANLARQSFNCNGIQIESNIQESDLIAYCKNVTVKDDIQIISGQNAMHLRGADQINQDDMSKTILNLRKISFTTDKGTYMKCYYQNSILEKCEYSQ